MADYEIVFIIGRIIAGLMFVMFGFNHFTMLDGMAQYAQSKGIPAPKIAVLGTGILLLFGGLSIGLGIYPLFGIIALAIFFIGVTPLMHDFWNVEDAQQKQNEMINFLKNTALLGLILTLTFTFNTDWPLQLVG